MTCLEILLPFESVERAAYFGDHSALPYSDQFSAPISGVLPEIGWYSESITQRHVGGEHPGGSTRGRERPRFWAGGAAKTRSFSSACGLRLLGGHSRPRVSELIREIARTKGAA